MNRINNISDLIKSIENEDINYCGNNVIKTVFYKGRKLFNLNSSNKNKAINKLKAINGSKTVSLKYKKSKRWVGDYDYYNNRLFYATVYID